MTRAVWTIRQGHYVRRLSNDAIGRVTAVNSTPQKQLPYSLVDFGFQNSEWIYDSGLILLPPMRQYRRGSQ